MICLQTPSFGWSFQDGRQLTSKPVHHNNELLDPVLFLRSVVPSRALQALIKKDDWNVTVLAKGTMSLIVLSSDD